MVGGKTESHFTSHKYVVFPVTETSENRVAGIQVIFKAFFFFFKSLWTLPPKVCYTRSQYLLTNALQSLDLKTQESTSLFQSKHNTAVDVWLDWAGTYCHILLTKKQTTFAFSLLKPTSHSYFTIKASFTSFTSSGSMEIQKKQQKRTHSF